jgi:WXG100 family type VII secretion target
MAQYGVSLQIDPAKMSAAARIIDNQRSIIENSFNSIFQDADRLKNSWEGNSADAYQPIMAKLASLQDEQSAAFFIVRALREYVLDLDKIAAQFTSTERQNKARDDALPADIFGV